MGFESILGILTIIVVINIILIATTKGDILREEEESYKTGFIVTFLILFLPVGLFLAVKYKDKNNKPWYLKFTLCWCMPLGLYLLWSKKTFNKGKKIKLTILSIILLVVAGAFYIGYERQQYIESVERYEEALESSKVQVVDESVVLYPFSKDGKIGYINNLGQVVIEPKYSNGAVFTEGIGMVQEDSTIKYIDKDGNEIMKLPEGINGKEVSDGVVVVDYDGINCGLFDNKGNCIKNLFEGYIYSFNEGYGIVTVGDKYGVINTKGEFVINPSYKWLGEYSEGLIPMLDDNGKYGYINLDGEVVIDCKYTRVLPFHSGYGIVASGMGEMPTEMKDYKIIDKEGNEIKSIAPTWVGEYGEGKYQFNQNNDLNKSGYISESGEILIEPIYNVTYNFSEGLAAVKNDEDKLGFINDKNEVIIPFKYSWLISGFTDGVAIVKNENNEFVYINKEGNEIFKGDEFDIFID